jgi:D-xylulose reductase
MVLGHESAGTVQAVGSAVTTLQAGDRVALEPGVSCRYCRACQRGSYNLCSKMRFAATPPYDGTLTDVYRLPEDRCHKIPDVVSLEEGALIEPLSVAVHIIVRQGSIQLGDNVIVFGAGPIGLLCCAVAKAYGAASIIAVDINASRLGFAAAYAATSIFNPSEHNSLSAAEIAQKLLLESDLPASGADLVVDASGAQASIRTGIHASRPGGTFVQGGMGNDDIDFPITAMCAKELNVKGSFRYGPDDYATAIRLVASGRVEIRSLITKRVPFIQAEDAFIEMAAGRGIKTIISGPSVSAVPFHK